MVLGVSVEFQGKAESAVGSESRPLNGSSHRAFLYCRHTHVPSADHHTEGHLKHIMQRPRKRACFANLIAVLTFCAFAVVCCALLWGPEMGMQPWTYPAYKLQDLPSIDDPQWRPWLKVSGIQVSAMVFYGRRQYVRVLDGYLKRNLASVGGLFEEVRCTNSATHSLVSKRSDFAIILSSAGPMDGAHR